MSKQEADILLIRKYLNGELDGPAMHRLERRAQDDPFLMDALEGYEKAKNDQRVNLDSLAKDLQQRITKRETPVIPWRMLGIAASILVFFTIGGLWLYRDREPVALKVAQLYKQKPKPATVTASRDSVVQDNVIASLAPPSHKQALEPPRPVIKAYKSVAEERPHANPLTSADVSAEEPANTDTDNTSLAEMVVVDMTKKNKDAAQSKLMDTTNKSRIFHQPNINTALSGRVAGVQVKPAEGKPLSGFFDSSLRRRIEGRVVDKMDGSPLPGVSVRIAGTNTGTLTDAEGHFKLPVDSNKTRLNIGFIGYESQNVNITKRDSLKTIAMVPSNKSLNEVVVVGYGTKKTDDEVSVIAAHPKDGWGSLRKYLKENAKSPDGKIGTVKLSFTVDRYGEVSDITVAKSLSPVADKKAIDLISDGPEWIGNSNGQPEKVTIRIKFIK
ncbi:MAG: carboxypeptidase-like regulatory domain-containing protein [Bacteroidota bacterium]|nr:carboxypeptidase-like regulatory domain-containing protein [Bacteroidota bacterium]